VLEVFYNGEKVENLYMLLNGRYKDGVGMEWSLQGICVGIEGPTHFTRNLDPKQPTPLWNHADFM